VKLADAVEQAIRDAREEVAKAKVEADGLAEGCDDALKLWINAESKKLDNRIASLEPRLVRANGFASKCRDDARKKENEELNKIEKNAIGMIKFHQTKHNLSNAEMFALVDSRNDDKIDPREFADFFKRCDKRDQGEHETKSEDLSEDDLARLFTSLDDDGQGSLSKDKFTSLIRSFMKVAKDTVITEELSIKNGTTLRRLEVGEVVEIITGPTKEPTVDVLRVRAHVMRDHVEGWITLKGNQGSEFLEEGGDLFKVVTETVLTPDFELDGEKDKETTQKLQRATRKLRTGEQLMVREWARKDDKSGLVRMKCKVKSDGSVGWVTTVGNQGNVYVQLM